MVEGGEKVAEDLEEIYRNHAQSVFRYLLSLTHDEDLAEELTEETFYRAVYSIHTYNGSCKISVWLCQIAKHVWYQELGKRKRQQTQELDEDIPSTGRSPEEAMLLKSSKMDLYRAIHKLDEPMREIVHMRISGEFSFAEIGEILGKSENWARVTFYRAKQKMMEVL
ncbi:sigma-70 family RNA polymerase sigma factor [Paenibacillus sp. PR3]|uniref:Sigma-70 family RNA polymerase sigma factor n=1 Tax=Paenibacillus terricola TaxID=2763503 RepID=A0ABR8N1K5_9BACL|nr:sigma-70 family RNA polymerase sigma factor [Paenibacillus terricola]